LRSEDDVKKGNINIADRIKFGAIEEPAEKPAR